MSYALWIVQGLLALLFLFTGGMKLVLPLEVLTEQNPAYGAARTFDLQEKVSFTLCVVGILTPRSTPTGHESKLGSQE